MDRRPVWRRPALPVVVTAGWHPDGWTVLADGAVPVSYPTEARARVVARTVGGAARPNRRQPAANPPPFVAARRRPAVVATAARLRRHYATSAAAKVTHCGKRVTGPATADDDGRPICGRCELSERANPTGG